LIKHLLLFLSLPSQLDHTTAQQTSHPLDPNPTRSGHGAFWTLTPLTLSSYYPHHPWPTALIWVALVQSSIRDFLEHMHYSIDMLLAVIVTAAVWGWLRWVYPESEPLQRRPEGGGADAPNPYVLGLVVFGLVTAAVAILVAKA